MYVSKTNFLCKNDYTKNQEIGSLHHSPPKILQLPGMSMYYTPIFKDRGKDQHSNMAVYSVFGGLFTTTLVAMSNTAVHKNLVAAQLPVTNCISGYGQPIVLQYFVWFPREWLRGFWNFASSSSTRLRSLAKSLSKETWLSCIIIEISASASSRRSVRKMKGYLWILNFRQRRSLCISAAQHLPSQLNGRDQR